jgi:hypothetical protein
MRQRDAFDQSQLKASRTLVKGGGLWQKANVISSFTSSGAASTSRLACGRALIFRWIGRGLLGAAVAQVLVHAGEAGMASRSGAHDVFDESMNAYHRTAASGAVAKLERRLENGEANLNHDPHFGYLPALLRELGLSATSQLLVASKTSPNRTLISPTNPRALYYNEQAAVAYVPGAPVLEIAEEDPKLGVVFYTLEQKPVDRPHLIRDDRCFECHASAKTLEVPGMLVRSFRTDVDGEVDVLSGNFVTDRTPFRDRWGGYYVTGTHGSLVHLGNLFGREAWLRHQADPSANGNVTNLAPFLDVAKYPGPGSDIVSLLVLDHQVQLGNLLTRLSYETSAALRRGDPDLRAIYPAAEAVVRYMLFLDAVPLNAPVRGTSGFAEWFENQGPKDQHGRSLRQFNLHTRLFEYPCSFMIYSPAFAALPVPAKKHAWHRLWQILSGQDKSVEFAGIPAETKRAIVEIINDTVTDRPAYWGLGE